MISSGIKNIIKLFKLLLTYINLISLIRLNRVVCICVFGTVFRPT